MATHRKSLALVSAGLAAGIAVGSIGMASAAVAPSGSGPISASLSGAASADVRECLADADSPGARRRGLDPLAVVVAGLTRTDVTDVMVARHAGKSLAMIAEANGINAGQVVAVATKRARADVAAAVRAGRLMPVEGSQVIAGLRARFMSQVRDPA